MMVPELLDALEAVLNDACGNCVECSPPESKNGCDNLVRAREILSRARGEVAKDTPIAKGNND